MLKLYKNLKAKDWALVILIIGITVAQVYFTMELTDQIANIVGAIQRVSMGVPGATTGDIWREGGLMLVFAVCSALCQAALPRLWRADFPPRCAAKYMLKWRAFPSPRSTAFPPHR